MRALLTPGMRLLERYGFARKFLALFLLFMLPQVCALWLLSAQYHEQLNSVDRAGAGVHELQALDVLEARLQEQRNLIARWKALITNLKDVPPEALEAIKKFESAFPQLMAASANLGQTLKTNGVNEATYKQFSMLERNLKKLDRSSMETVGWWPYGYDQFTAVLAQVQTLRGQINTESNLILEPWPETYLLTQMATQQQPDLAERIGRLASIGHSTVLYKQFTMQSRLQVTDLRTRIGDSRDQLDASGALLKSKLPAEMASWNTTFATTMSTLDAGLKTLDAGLFTNGITLSADEFVTTLNGMQQSLSELRSTSLHDLDRRLVYYHTQALRNFIGVIGCVSVLLVIAVYLFVCLQASIRRSTKGITTLAESLRDGDLRTQIKVHGRDELAGISSALNTAVMQLCSSLQNVDRETGNLGGAVKTLSSEATASLTAVEAQQHQISQIASATVELATTAQQVAESCEKATQEANQSRGIAERSSVASQGTTASIRELNVRLGSTASALSRLNVQAQQISKVVDVIRGIAEQTNLLALNAAIEAARAGDQGRGFAVVADEVRSLSQRTQASTQEIVGTVNSLQNTVGEAVKLMELACGQAETDAESVTALGDSLVEIATAVQRVSTTLGQIATAVEQQALTADEVSESVQQVDQAALRLLDGARAVHRATDTLNSGSQALTENTARFHLV